MRREQSQSFELEILKCFKCKFYWAYLIALEILSPPFREKKKTFAHFFLNHLFCVFLLRNEFVNKLIHSVDGTQNFILVSLGLGGELYIFVFNLSLYIFQLVDQLAPNIRLSFRYLDRQNRNVSNRK